MIVWLHVTYTNINIWKCNFGRFSYVHPYPKIAVAWKNNSFLYLVNLSSQEPSPVLHPPRYGCCPLNICALPLLIICKLPNWVFKITEMIKKLMKLCPCFWRQCFLTNSNFLSTSLKSIHHVGRSWIDVILSIIVVTTMFSTALFLHYIASSTKLPL